MARVFFVLISVCYLIQVHGKSFQKLNENVTQAYQERFFGRELDETDDYEIIHPIRVNERGDFLSNDLSHGLELRQRSLHSSEKPEPAFFKVAAFGEDLHIRAVPNTKLFTPRFAVEVVDKHGRARRMKRAKMCHYLGDAMSKGQIIGKVAISNCDGLSGVISTKRGTFMVNPLPLRLGQDKNSKRAHVIVKTSAGQLQHLARDMGVSKKPSHWCGVKDDPIPGKRSSSVPVCSNNFGNKTFYVETLVVVDDSMTSHHGVASVTAMLPVLLNIVHGLLADNSIGAKIDYVINKLLIHEAAQSGLVVSDDPYQTLDSFCQWSHTNNNQDDSQPVHYDHATLIARRSWSGGNVLGLAGVKGMCVDQRSCTINRDKGLQSAFTIAHETGHNLGSEHDASGTYVCPDGVNIMSGTGASGAATAFEWSPCSCKDIQTYLNTGGSSCLNDAPTQEESFPSTNELPGETYSKDDQCRMIHTSSASYCSGSSYADGVICNRLYCKTSSSSSCSTSYEPAAEGTTCGDGKWCRYGQCVDTGSSGPAPIDGGWGEWGAWGSCSHTCGGGVQIRSRACTNPAPQNHGALCVGSDKDYKYCDNAACPSGTPNTRQTQCQAQTAYSLSWSYDPVYSQPSGPSERCILKCISGNYYMLFGPVIDGSRCDGAGDPGMCINNGECKKLGCDNVLGSSAVNDQCGVCNGDGSSC